MKYLGAVVAVTLAAALASCGASKEEGADDGSATATASEAAPAMGKIAGNLTYPSDYIPEDMEVCAEDTSSKEVTCKGGFKDGKYTMELPAGTYHVWSRTDDAPQGYRAYYNEAVKCGLDIACKDRTPIKVEVKGGETVAKVDPGDWYAQQ